MAALSDAGLRRSEASSLTWGDVQRWDDGSGRITVIRSKTDVEAAGAVVAITPVAMQALDAIRPKGVASDEKVFGLSESQIARRVKAIGQGRRSGRLGVLQRPQRAGGHGSPDGSERRAHPRDRTPGTLETGWRHGRPLYSWRVRRIRAAVSVSYPPLHLGEEPPVLDVTRVTGAIGSIRDAENSAQIDADEGHSCVYRLEQLARVIKSHPHALRRIHHGGDDPGSSPC